MKFIYMCIALLFSAALPSFTHASGNIYLPGMKHTLQWSWGAQLGISSFLESQFVVVARSTRSSTASKQKAHSIIRTEIIKQILDKQVVSFIQRPYKSRNSNYGVTIRDNKIVSSAIEESDDLDLIINNALIRIRSGNQNLTFAKKDFVALGPIYLWKNEQELQSIGYQVVSSRYRTNNDPSYRRHNIYTAFNFLWNIKVLNPWESFNYLWSIHYDPKQGKNYKNGLAIVQDEEIPVYGWWICWGSTATYQWLITNTALTLQWRNHSKWFSNLYTAVINGKKISTPGIDATVFAWSVDIKITNSSDHPIIIALNYNGNFGGIEEVFSLGLPKDQWSLEFISQKTSYKKVTKKDQKTKENYSETVKTWCYTRKINGLNKTSCYKEVH